MPHAQGGRLLVRGGGGAGVDRLEWDRGSATRCAAQATAAGLVAGLMGVGGGILLGPLMLHMGVHPEVSSATTATMILLTSSSAAAAFLAAAQAPLHTRPPRPLACHNPASHILPHTPHLTDHTYRPYPHLTFHTGAARLLARLRLGELRRGVCG